MKKQGNIIFVRFWALLVAAVLIFQMFPAFADPMEMPEGAEALTGQSIHRLSDTEATIRFHSEYQGRLLRAVTKEPAAPDFTDTEAWKETGDIGAGKILIQTVELEPGIQYVHWVVQSGDVFSSVLTNEIPAGGYIFEDFETFDINMSTKNSSYLPLYKNGSTSYGGQANGIVSNAEFSEGVPGKGFRVLGANDSYTGSSDQRMTMPANIGNEFTVEFDVIQLSSPGSFAIYSNTDKILSIEMSSFDASSMTTAVTSYSTSKYGVEFERGYHHIKVCIDMLSGTYNYYVDGVIANTDTLYANIKGAPAYIQFWAANRAEGSVYDNIKVTTVSTPVTKGQGIYRTDEANADIYFWSGCPGNVYYTVSNSNEKPSAQDVKNNGTKIENIVFGTNKLTFSDLSGKIVYINAVVENTAGLLSEVSQYALLHEKYYFDDNESYYIGTTPPSVTGRYNTGNTQPESLENDNRVFRANAGYGTYYEYHSSEYIKLPEYTVEEGKSLLVLEADVTPVIHSPGPLFFGKTTGAENYVAGVNFSSEKLESVGGTTTHKSKVTKTLGETYHMKVEYDAYTRMFYYYINGQPQNYDPIESKADFDTDSINLFTGTLHGSINVDNLTFYITEGSVNKADVLIGDVNGDGIVSAEDLTALARHVAKIEEITDPSVLKAADVDGNEEVDANDLTKLARYVAKIIDTLD